MFANTSNGHIAFIPDTHRGYWEYFSREGSIYRASADAPVMPDGFRSGRWYSYDRNGTREHLQGIEYHLTQRKAGA